jgi:hypothetical protein
MAELDDTVVGAAYCGDAWDVYDPVHVGQLSRAAAEHKRFAEGVKGVLRTQTAPSDRDLPTRRAGRVQTEAIP